MQGLRRRSRRAPLALGAVLGLLLPVLATAAPAPGPVRDLYYGDTLFHFYQDDHFTALTSLIAARASGRVPHHEAESELLLGGLYLHYGQHRRAERIFTALLDSQASPSVRDRAWFYLGKLRYQRGFYADALANLARVQGELPPALKSQWPMLVAQSHLALGQYAEAIAVLDGWQGPEGWAAYARYNLGVALVRLGRLDEGALQLARVGGVAAGMDRERRTLADKANLALGYGYLQASRDAEAAPLLQQVRLHGPFSSKALLGLGWALAAEGQYQAALAPWQELKGRDLLDTAVQESLLAIPYAYGQLADHDRAAEQYRSALNAFDGEIGRLDAAIGRARDGSFIPAVLKSDDPGIGRWSWELESVPDTDESRYLYHLIADHGFQEGLRNVRDLRALERHLDDWAERLVAFDDMVATRREAFRRRDPSFSAGLAAVDLDPVRTRRDALAGRLDAAVTNRDVAGLATTAELDRWQRLAAVEASPEFVAAGTDVKERHRLLKGVLQWDLDREYAYRVWKARGQLRQMDAVLGAAGDSQLAATGSRQALPGALDGFAARIAAARPRIAALRDRVRRARTEQEGMLQALAVQALGEQRERLAAYRVQAQFALATIYDRAATAARNAPARNATPESLP